MAIKWKELEKVIEEAKVFLEGGVVQKISQSEALADGHSFHLQGYNPESGPWRLWICLLREHTMMAILPEELKPDSAKEPNHFVMVLRKHILGRRILQVEQLDRDRVVLIHFELGFALLVELIPKYGNLVLLKEVKDHPSMDRRGGVCLGSHEQVSLEKGGVYLLPPPPPTPTASSAIAAATKLEARNFPGVEQGGPLAWNYAAARFFWNLLGNRELMEEKRVWRQMAKAQRKKMGTAWENAKRDFEAAKEAEDYQRRGKALVANLYQLGPQNYPKVKELEIDGELVPLDPLKTFSENSEALFKKAKKFSRASVELEGRVLELDSRVAVLDDLIEKIDAADSHEQLLELKESLRGNEVDVERLGARREPKVASAKPYLETLSSDGFLILCGRNQEENRRVTFQEAKGNDLWMHVKAIPGAHCVIKQQKNKTIPLSTLLEAAQLTLYHSKVREGRRVEVDYTMRKYVKSIKGTVANVTYTGNKSLYVEFDPQLWRKLMERA